MSLVTPQPLIFLPTQAGELHMMERFSAKFQVAANGCHHWTGTLDRDGYGWFSLPKPRSVRRAHRFAYRMFVGNVPDGTVLDHDCHTRDRMCPGGPGCMHRRCVNPAHLVALPERVNILLGRGLAAKQAQQTHCKRNHPLSGPGSDVYVHKGGRRQCRPCKVISKRAYQEALAAGLVTKQTGRGRPKRTATDLVLTTNETHSSEAGRPA